MLDDVAQEDNAVITMISIPSVHALKNVVVTFCFILFNFYFTVIVYTFFSWVTPRVAAARILTTTVIVTHHINSNAISIFYVVNHSSFISALTTSLAGDV